MNKDEPVLKSYTDSTFIATARCKKMDYGYQGEGGVSCQNLKYIFKEWQF